MVFASAAKWRDRVSQETHEDLVQAGFLGLCRAAQRFDPALGLVFPTLAQFYVRGAIVDELRQQGHCSRTYYARGERVTQVGLEAADELSDPAPLPLEVAMREERNGLVRGAVAALPLLEKKVIRLYYWEGIRFSHMRDLGFSSSYLSLVHRRALTRLRGILGGLLWTTTSAGIPP